MRPLANKHTLEISSHCLEEDTVNTDDSMFARLVRERGEEREGRGEQIFANEQKIVSQKVKKIFRGHNTHTHML